MTTPVLASPLSRTMRSPLKKKTAIFTGSNTLEPSPMTGRISCRVTRLLTVGVLGCSSRVFVR